LNLAANRWSASAHGKDRTPILGDLGGPVGLVVGTSDDKVYLTEAFAGQVSKVATKGEKTMIAKDLKMPEGIALSPNGKLIVAEVGAKRLVEIDPSSGNVTEIAGNLPIGGLVASPGLPPADIPTGVGGGASGTIYFSSDIENAIYKVSRK
jgi:DNA-binding beta-propeller fold protein YncE